MYLKDQLISILNLGRTELTNHLTQVDPAQEIFPSWNLTEVLAHFAGWDEVLCQTLDAHARGEVYAPADFPDVDLLNQQSVDARRGWSLEEATADFERMRERLIQLLKDMPDDKFEEPALFPGAR